MITSRVNANREATIRLLVLGPQGHQQEIEAIIDTGFTGFLTLPPMLVTTLGLAWLCRQAGILADGRVEYFDVYIATVTWDGQPRTVEVEAADTEPEDLTDGFKEYATAILALWEEAMTDDAHGCVLSGSARSAVPPGTVRRAGAQAVSGSL